MRNRGKIISDLFKKENFSNTVCHKWITKKLYGIRTQRKSGHESMRVRWTDCVFGEQSIGRIVNKWRKASWNGGQFEEERKKAKRGGRELNASQCKNVHMVFCVSHCVLMCLTVCLVFCFYCVTLCFPALLMFGAVLKWCTRSLFPMPASLFGNIKIKGTSWGIGSRFGTHPLCEGVHWCTMSFCFVLVHPRGLTKSMIINWCCWFDSPRLKPRFCGPQRLEILFSFVCVCFCECDSKSLAFVYFVFERMLHGLCYEYTWVFCLFNFFF